MKVVHICLGGAVTDGYGYQANVLTKYQRRMGYDVTIIASKWVRGDNGGLQLTDKSSYVNADGVKMVRLSILVGNMDNRLKIYPDLIKAVTQESPDILFIHDCQFLDICRLAQYARKHLDVRVYVDNHSDYRNSAHGWLSRNILHKMLWRYCVHRIEPYVTRFYGVTPGRVDFLVDMYGIPRDRCELLVMGIDDEQAEQAKGPGVRERIRNQYGIAEGDFLIVTGGKINHWRPETLLLMEAVIAIDRPNVRLLVFGSVAEELQDRFDMLIQSPQITFAGWQNAIGTYEIMGAADLVVFPGLHSVMWEQAVGLGIPCIFRDLEGFHHIDLGGNAILLQDVSRESIQSSITELLNDPARYAAMRQVAEAKGMQTFSYLEIARRSLEET